MTLTINKSDIEKLTAKIVRFANDGALRVAANVVKEQERGSTSIGRDYKANAFAPYKKRTFAWRGKKGLVNSFVNLRVTGGLRDSRFYNSSTKELMYNSKYEDIAKYLQGGTTVMKAREFVGVFGDTDKIEIEDRVAEAFNRL